MSKNTNTNTVTAVSVWAAKNAKGETLADKFIIGVCLGKSWMTAADAVSDNHSLKAKLQNADEWIWADPAKAQKKAQEIGEVLRSKVMPLRFVDEVKAFAEGEKARKAKKAEAKAKADLEEVKQKKIAESNARAVKEAENKAKTLSKDKKVMAAVALLKEKGVNPLVFAELTK